MNIMVLFICFANMNEINDNYTPIIINQVGEYIVNVRNKIKEITTTINAATKIHENRLNYIFNLLVKIMRDLINLCKI